MLIVFSALHYYKSTAKVFKSVSWVLSEGKARKNPSAPEKEKCVNEKVRVIPNFRSSAAMFVLLNSEIAIAAMLYFKPIREELFSILTIQTFPFVSTKITPSSHMSENRE